MISMYNKTRSSGEVVSVRGVIDVILIVLFVFLIILHVVCLSVVVAKNHEIVDKFDPQHKEIPDDNDVCVFFIDDDHPIGDAGSCDFVIYCSGALIITALLMITFLVARTVLPNTPRIPRFLCVVDLVEILVTGILATAVAITTSNGTTRTCDTITEATGQSKCSDIYLYGHKKPTRAIKLYPAMITAVVTSWIAAVIMLVIAMVTVTRMLMFIIRRNARNRGTVTMVKYNKLQDIDDYNL